METIPKKYTIPPKDRAEWKKIVSAQIEHKFRNFVLQMKSTDYKQKIEQGQISTDEAVDELYELCEKYAIAVQNDFKEIFKDW